MLGKSQLIFLGRKVLRAWGQGWGHVYPAPWSGKSWRVRVQILLKDSTSFQGLSVSTREQPGARVRRSEGKSCGDEADPAGCQLPGTLSEEVIETTGLPVDPGAIGGSPPPPLA